MIVDLHFHTEIQTSGYLRAEDLLAYIDETDLVAQARSQGIEAICLTEHDRAWPRSAVRIATEQTGFLFLSGMEVSTNYAEYGHVLTYGLTGYVGGIYDVVKLRLVAEREGAALVVAHPFREHLSPYRIEPPTTVADALSWPIFQLVDGIECHNGSTKAKENELAAEVCRQLGKPATGGSDAHRGMGVGAAVTLFERELRNEADLVAEIKAGRCRPALWRNGAYVPV